MSDGPVASVRPTWTDINSCSACVSRAESDNGILTSADRPPQPVGLIPAEIRCVVLSENAMARYGKKAGQKVKRAMHERKSGKLRSGRSGRKVTSLKQSIAVGLSEA